MKEKKGIIEKIRNSKPVQYAIDTVVGIASGFAINAAIPVFDKFFAGASRAYAGEALAATDAHAADRAHAQGPQETKMPYQLPKELKMPKITPAMRKFMEEIGIAQYRKEGVVYNLFFCRKTEDGLYEYVYDKENKKFHELKNNVLQSVKDTAPEEIVEGIKASSDAPFMYRKLDEYANRVWDELFVNLVVGLTEVERPQLIEQQKRLLAARKIGMVVFAHGETKIPFIADVSAGDFNFVNMTIKGDIRARYKYKLAVIKMMMQGNTNQILAMVSFPQEKKEKSIEPIRTHAFEFYNNDRIGHDITSEFNTISWPRAVKELEKQIIMPSNKWIVQSTRPPVIVKNPGSKTQRALLSPSDDPELVQLLIKRGIISKESLTKSNGKDKRQGFLSDPSLSNSSRYAGNDRLIRQNGVQRQALNFRAGHRG